MRRAPKTLRRSLRIGGRVVLATALLGLSAGSAQAQDVGTSSASEMPPPMEPPPAEPPTADATPPPAPVAPTEAEKKNAEELVVTGSRIKRVDLVTPAPVAVLTKEEFQDSGLSSIGQILQNLPSQSNAINVQFNNGGDGSTRVALRGVGDARTLVLLNGRRFVAGGLGADPSVDLNAIPISIIDRVEVLKDGASAIYGSDAIGGVVNIITKKDFSGVEGAVYTGSGQVGGLIYDLSLTAGHTSDRGNVLLSFSYYNQGDIFAGDRDFSNPDRDIDYASGEIISLGSSSIPQTLITDYGPDEGCDGCGNAAWQAVVATDPEGGQYLNDKQNGGWRPYDGSGTMDTGEGDQYNYQPENYLLTPQTRYSLFATGNYELVKRMVNVFGEASYTNRQSDQLLAPEPLFTITEGIVTSANNPYNPFGRDFIDIRRRLVEAGDRRFLEDVDTYRAVVGINGGLPEGMSVLSDWTWDASFIYGRTEGTQTKQGSVVRSRLINALGPGYIDGDGVAQCGSPDAPIDGCVPLDLFGGEGAITPEMLRYIQYTGVARGFSQQQIVDVGIGGPLFSLLDHDVGLAIGYEWRREEGGFQPDPLTASGDTTGNKGEATLGNYRTNAVYGELDIPLAFNVPAIELFELTGALRFVNYNTFGSELTWKAGARWQLFEHLALRGSASRSFRGPSVSELFSGQADDFPNVSDPCADPQTDVQTANCTADGVLNNDNRTQLPARVGGNPDLGAETADVFTAGVVFTPKFGRYLDGLSVTVDYWNLAIDNAIQPAGANVLLANCYNKSGADRTDCDKIVRGAGNLITSIVDTETNVGGTRTAGIDMGLIYRIPTDIGNFRYSFEATWLQKYNTIQPDGSIITGKGVYDLGVYPDWKFNTTLSYGIKGFAIGFNVRFVNGFKECEGDICTPDPDTGEIPPQRNVDSWVSGDVFASYQLAWDWGLTDLSAGINNIANATPPFIDNGFLANSDASTYDYIGRYFYFRLGHTF